MVNPTTGITMGHEASGTIHSIGRFVSNVSIGDRVAIEPGTPCRICKTCKAGTYNLCRKMRFAAAPGPPDTQGTLTKYWRIASDFVYKIPDTMSLEEGVLVEPLAVAVHAASLADIRPGETVVVTGSGTIGMLCAAVVRQFGAHRIIIVDLLKNKLDFAKGYLHCETFLSRLDQSAQQNAERLLKEFGLQEEGTDTSGGSVDTVIEASGAGSSIEMGIEILRPGGKFVQTGLGKPKVEFPIVALSQKEVSQLTSCLCELCTDFRSLISKLMLRGCFRYGAGDYALAIGLLEKGLVEVKSLVSSITPFERAPDAWDKTGRGEGIKNLIQGVKD